MWNEKEECYLGWERKRGLLTELNEFLISEKNISNAKQSKNNFIINTIQSYRGKEKLDIKYIITLDTDTNLTLNSGIELIEAMAHPLNKPVIDKTKDVVVKGFGIMQPRVGIDLETSFQSKFTEIFAGDGGVDSYTNAISDIYQDNFDEGIYTGKGIYDLEVFYKVMKDKIPENTVLSHDLLEGCYLRCGLCSDIMLLDEYPSSYKSYMTRLARWIRGDWQIISWLKSKDLNKLSKYKILDNIRRSMVEISSAFNLIFLIIIKIFVDVKIMPFVLISFFSVAIASILDIINYIIFRKENVKIQKKFTKRIDGLKASIYRGIISIANLPTKSYLTMVSIIKTIYRMKVTKKYLLEWTTSEEAERKNKKDLKTTYFSMLPNIIVGIIGILLPLIIKFEPVTNWTLGILSLVWIISPFIMYYISKSTENINSLEKLNTEEQEYIKKVAVDTWKYFADFMDKQNNFIPPDNLQESRREKIVSRTSATNIGLGLLTIVSAYDLKFITLEKAITSLENSINTIEKLDKWNGHLYNWYSTKTLKPLIPRYISTVDSGNFVRIFIYTKNVFRRKTAYTV